MTVEHTLQPLTRRATEVKRSSGTIVAATYREDGWEIEVENLAGIRLAYWVGGSRSAPSIGSTVHFFHGRADNRVCSIEIDGQRLFDTCTA